MSRFRNIGIAAAAFFLVAIPPFVIAQELAPAPVDESAALGPPIPVAPVTLDGRVLFTLRGVSAYPAEQRAGLVSGAIREVARNPAVDPASLTLDEEGTITRVMAGESRVVGLVDADARLEGVTRHELALVVLGQIRHAIEQYRAERQPDAIAAAGLRVAGATAVLALALAVLLWLWRRLDRSMAARVEQHLRTLGVESVRAGSAERAGELLRGGLRAVRTLAVLVTVFFYLQVVLGLFPWTREAHARLADWVIGPLETMGRAIVDQIPNVIFLLILFLVLRWVLGLIRLFFDAVGRGAVTLAGFDPDWAQPTFKIVRLVVVAFGVVVAYPYIPGSSTAAFKGVSLFAGVVFSLGSTSVISNLIAGFTMTYRRAFRVGDRVRIGDVMGDVTEIRLQVTNIRTPKNEEVVVPNSTILGSEVTNYSALARSRGLILHTTVGIGYETPWRQVEAMLLLAAERTPGLLREPAPFVLQKALGDFCVTYELNVYCNQPQAMNRLYTDLHRSILDAFNEYGVQIMTPAYEADTEQPKVVPRDQWFAAPAVAPSAAPDATRMEGPPTGHEGTGANGGEDPVDARPDRNERGR